MMEDTIAAVATAPGEGPIAIVRISGADAKAVFQRAFRPARGVIAPGKLLYGHVIDGTEAIDEAMGVYLSAPHTYTREDVCEIQCHGGSACLSRVFGRVLDAGARLAEPGEFTRRAFLNGRIDLAEAEAVMGMIAAQSEEARRAQLRALSGGISRKISEWTQTILDILSGIAAAIDFPEEIEDARERRAVAQDLRILTAAIAQAANMRYVRSLKEGVRVALVGRPNTGKSSILNALLQEERAITSAIPGTTRDTLTGEIAIRGRNFVFTDTAGQHESQDPIEQIGIARAREAARQSDIALVVLDGSAPLTKADHALLNAPASPEQTRVIAVNKSDLTKAFSMEGGHVFRISAKTGAGMPELLDGLYTVSGGARTDTYLFTSQRHVRLAQAANESLVRALDALESGVPWDCVEVDLQDALDALLTITGKNASETVIEEVFRNFCVGK